VLDGTALTSVTVWLGKVMIGAEGRRSSLASRIEHFDVRAKTCDKIAMR
jgi:hypothetical protein